MTHDPVSDSLIRDILGIKTGVAGEVNFGHTLAFAEEVKESRHQVGVFRQECERLENENDKILEMLRKVVTTPKGTKQYIEVADQARKLLKNNGISDFYEVEQSLNS